VLIACTPPVKQYELKDQPLSCDEANQLAYRTVRAMGFKISEFAAAAPGSSGSIRGRRERPGSGAQNIVVTVTCTAAGATIDAGEAGKLFDQVDLKRGFHHSFTNIVQMKAADDAMEKKIDAGIAPPSQQRHDLQILVEPIRGHESKLYFEIDLAAAGLLPVRLSVNNHTARRYAIQPDQVRLTAADRSRARPLTAAAAAERVARAREPKSNQPLTALSAAAVATRLGEKSFSATEVGPGDKASGYLFFPLAEYERARVVVEDEESGEAEGFLVEF
jgi:hypothetical protein